MTSCAGVLKSKSKIKNKGKYFINFTGGKIDYVKNNVEENSLIAAARELWEESGIRLNFGNNLNKKIKAPEDLKKFNDDKELLDKLSEQLIQKNLIDGNRNFYLSI